MPVNDTAQVIATHRSQSPQVPQARTLSVVVPAKDEEESLPLLVGPRHRSLCEQRPYA